MGIENKEYVLRLATGIDTTELYTGRREVLNVLRSVATQIAALNVFGGIEENATTSFAEALRRASTFEKAFGHSLSGITTLSDQMGISLAAHIDRIAELRTAFDFGKKTEQQIDKELLAMREKNQQDKIELMEEGHAKVLARYEKEITEILAKETEWKKVQGGKLTSEQSAEIRTGLTNALVKKEKATSDIDKKQLEAEKQAMNNYLAEYGRYLQKRQALTDTYNSKIAQASTEGEKMSLGEEMKKEIAALDESTLKKASGISSLFSDMSKRTVFQIKKIVKDAQKAYDYLTGGEFKEKKNGVDEFGWTEDEFTTLSLSEDQLKDIENKLATVRNETTRTESAFKKIGSGLKTVFSAKWNSKQLKEGLAEIEAGMKGITQAGQFLSGALADMGEAFDSGALKGIAEGINVALDAADSTMKGAQAGAIFGPIGASAGAALGMVSSLASSIAKIHDAKKEKEIEKLQMQVDELGRAYDVLGKSIEKAYSSEASDLIDEQNGKLEEQKSLIEQQKKEEEEKKKTDKKRIKDYEKQLQSIEDTIAENKEKAQNAIFGEDVKTAINNFAQAYVDAWAAGEDKANSMKDVVKKMIKGIVVEMMKSDLTSTVEDLRKKIVGFLDDDEISENEQAQLDQMIEEAYADMDSNYKWADKYLKGEEKASSRQAATKSVASSMSQESANELNGNFNSLLVYSNRTADNTASIRESLSYILEIQKNGWEDVRIIKELTGQVQINTAQLTALSGTIASNTQRVAAGMDILTMNGLTLKR